MAGAGGGSWKVAYADFVTAMMAFFLVMWLGAQDQKTRQSVANYFIDPSGVDKKPLKQGAVLETVRQGTVPEKESVDGGKGRSSHTSGEPSPSTKRVNSFLQNDKKLLKQWQEKAQAQREIASKSREVLEKKISATELAVEELAKSLRTEMTKDIAKTKNSLQQDLLYDSFNGVNWKQLAEDLLYD